MSVAARACLACGAQALSLALDLGECPPAHLLVRVGIPDPPNYPLALMSCAACGHGQLSYFMQPEDLFSQYLYASGTSGTLRAYFAWFRDQIIDAYGRDVRVLEIACNDGSLLELFDAAGCETLGVDPAANLAQAARAKGLNIIEDFWPCREKLTGQFDVIIAMNVTAHTPDPLAFMEGIRDVLTDTGAAFIQTSQAMMLDNGEFDTIYHEHYSFFTARSFDALARRAGLELRRTVLTDIHGVSSVFVVTRPGAPPPPEDLLAHGAFAVAPGGQLAERFAAIKGEADEYLRFASLALSRMKDVGHRIEQARHDGRVIGFVGAAAKSLTFIHASRIRPDHLYDEAPLKIGMGAPGLGLTIEALDTISQIEAPMLIVLSAWNFAAELARKTRQRRPGRHDQFMVYFPSLSVFDA
jgi:SAM-dependent methyltransferase